MMIRFAPGTIVAAVTFLIWMGSVDLYGQEMAGNSNQLEKTSLASFDQGHFRSALKGFTSLLDLDSDNLLYKYYTGRCLVELNEDLDKAIELLYSPSRNNEPRDAVFYLGEAYRRSYNFRDAIDCFEKYEMTASRQERKTVNLNRLIETCRSAEEITSEYNPYEVMNVTFLDLSDSSQFSQVKMKGGDLTKKPESYFQPDEDHDGLTALMFRPKDAIRGDYLYYSGYGRNEKDGAQILRIRKLPGNRWSDPEAVSALNTSGDEILPYFDPIENDIYFASDGKLGMGGFDLYKSHYDMERDQWSESMNLGFPVNSVMDEYLLLPGSDLGMVLFFSNRDRSDSAIAVYRLHLVEPKKQLPRKDPAMLREIAQLGGAANEMLADLAKPDDSMATPYRETLSEALSHQAISDSLKDLAVAARNRIRESNDPNDRWVWQKQIMLWEKRAGDEQAIADELYAKTEKAGSDQSAAFAVNPPESIVVDRVIGDLTVYRYNEPGTDTEEKPGARGRKVNENSGSPPVSRFDILGQSPYNDNNPVPMDIDLPSGIFYRIQLGAYGTMPEPDLFGGISPITGEHVKERGLIKYYAGEFSRYEDASTALPRVHSLGYEDAFIVAWYNGHPVSTQKAKQLE